MRYLAWLLLLLDVSVAFSPLTGGTRDVQPNLPSPHRISTRLYDGFFGVGAPEVVVTVAVGYFLLGPEELLKLAQQGGRFVGQVRHYLSDATSLLEQNLDGVDMDEIRQAKRQLDDLVSFRYTGGSMPSLESIQRPNRPKGPKKTFRQKVKVSTNRGDSNDAVETPLNTPESTVSTSSEEDDKIERDAAVEQIRRERLQRLQKSNLPDAFGRPERSIDNDARVVSPPTTQVMELLALLEQEKLAADQRLQNEFQQRREQEEYFYREKRRLLESMEVNDQNATAAVNATHQDTLVR